MRFPDTFSAYDGESAADVPRPAAVPGLPPGTWLWRSSPAASSPHAEEFAAAELVAMFHSYFLGSAEGLLFDVPDDDYDSALWAPLGRYLHRLGVEIRTVHVRALVQPHDDEIVDRAGGGEFAHARMPS